MCDLFLMGWVLEQRNSRRRPRAFIRAHLWQLAQARGRGRIVLFQVGEEQGWEGIPPPQTSQFCVVCLEVLTSLSFSTLPEHTIFAWCWTSFNSEKELTDSIPWQLRRPASEPQVPHLKNWDNGIMPPVREIRDNICNVQFLVLRSPISGHYFPHIISRDHLSPLPFTSLSWEWQILGHEFYDPN